MSIQNEIIISFNVHYTRAVYAPFGGVGLNHDRVRTPVNVGMYMIKL